MAREGLRALHQRPHAPHTHTGSESQEGIGRQAVPKRQACRATPPCVPQGGSVCVCGNVVSAAAGTWCLWPWEPSVNVCVQRLPARVSAFRSSDDLWKHSAKGRACQHLG
eukprot:365216-Chlamydomonas_euryale.AAC.8